MTDQTVPQQSGTSRRDFLRRGAIVGGTLVWAAPAVQAIAPSALAQYHTDLYNEGANEAFWVQGFVGAGGSQSKQPDHLLIDTGTGNGAQRAWVTDTSVDLTGVSTIEVEWANTSTANLNRESYLIASTDQQGDHTVQNARLSSLGTFARRVETLDVAGLAGNHFIRVHARSAASNAISQLRTYRVTLR